MTQDTKLVRGQHSATTDAVLKAVKDLSVKTEIKFSEVSKEIKVQADKTDKQFDDVLEVINVFTDKTDKQIDDVLEVINVFADKTEKRFNKIDGEFSGIKGEVSGIKGEISGINKRLTRVEATMVTKDYLDEKMFDLRGDLVVVLRKEDTKLKTLVGVLKEKEVLNNADVNRICSIKPFVQ